MGTRIFLAGAAGAIGRPLIALLREAGHEVTGTTRSAKTAEELRALGSQAHHFGGDRAIVGQAAAFAARGPGAKGGLAQIASA